MFDVTGIIAVYAS